MGTTEFNVNNAFTVRIEYRTAYDRYASNGRYSSVIFDMYMKRINSETNVLGGVSTFSITFNNKTQDLLFNKYVGIPNDSAFHKVGTKDFGNTNTDSARNANIIVTGTSTDYNMNFSAVSSVSIPRGTAITQNPSQFTLSASSVYLGDEITINIQKNADTDKFKVRFYWADIRDEYQYFYRHRAIGNEWVALQSNTTDTFSGDNSLLLGDTSSIKLILPISLASHLKSMSSDTCYIELISYLDDGTALFKQKSFYRTIEVKIPENYKPKIDSHSINFSNENSIVDYWGICLQGYSKASASFTASHNAASDTAPIQYNISCAGVLNTNSNSAETVNALPRAGNNVFTFTATDSRGRTATVTDTLAVVPYSPPTIGIKELYRKTSADSVGVDTGGSYLHVETVENYSSCNGNNAVTLKIYWKEVPNGSYQASGVPLQDEYGEKIEDIDAGLEKTTAYNIKITVVDSLGNTDYIEDGVLNYKILMHFLTGGQALGIGMYNYQNDTLKIGYDLYIREDKIDDIITERGSAVSEIYNGWNDFSGDLDIVWYYEKYASGKVELYGKTKELTVQLTSNSVNSSCWFEFSIPEIDGEPLIPTTAKTGEVLMLMGSASNYATLSEYGRNGSYIAYIIMRTGAQSSTQSTMNFHIVYIPPSTLNSQSDDSEIIPEEEENGNQEIT